MISLMKVFHTLKKLANDYNIIPPALFHNSLINMGLKEKGYCYHYANDLLKYLKTKDYKSFHLKKSCFTKRSIF